MTRAEKIDRIEEIMKSWLPYYQREDKDDYLYIANKADIAKVAKFIAEDPVLWGKS